MLMKILSVAPWYLVLLGRMPPSMLRPARMRGSESMAVAAAEPPRECPNMAVWERLRWDVKGRREEGGLWRVLRRWVMSFARS